MVLHPLRYRFVLSIWLAPMDFPQWLFRLFIHWSQGGAPVRERVQLVQISTISLGFKFMGVISILIGIINQLTSLGGHHLAWTPDFLVPRFVRKNQELLLPFLQDPVFIDTGTLAGSHLVEFKAHMPEVYPIIYIYVHIHVYMHIYINTWNTWDLLSMGLIIYQINERVWWLYLRDPAVAGPPEADSAQLSST